MTTSNAVSICLKNGLIVYPINIDGKWKIQYKLKGNKPVTYPKILTSKNEVNEAHKKTYEYWAKKL